MDSDLYILDNPTQGIDVGAKNEVYHLIHNLALKGKSVIIFSSEYHELEKISNLVRTDSSLSSFRWLSSAFPHWSHIPSLAGALKRRL